MCTCFRKVPLYGVGPGIGFSRRLNSTIMTYELSLFLFFIRRKPDLDSRTGSITCPSAGLQHVSALVEELGPGAFDTWTCCPPGAGGSGENQEMFECLCALTSSILWQYISNITDALQIL